MNNENSENIKGQESKQDEPETGEKILVKEENQEVKEPSLQDEENIGKNEISEDSDMKESKEEPESNAKTPNKPSQNITDKF